MAINLFNIMESIIHIIPDEESQMRNSMISLHNRFISDTTGYSSELCNELLCLLNHYIKIPKKNWQRKLYEILKDEKPCLSYLKITMN